MSNGVWPYPDSCATRMPVGPTVRRRGYLHHEPDAPELHMTRTPFIALLLVLPAVAADPPAKSVPAVVESSLKTAGGNIRQFAFDEKLDTYFESAGNPGKDDHFTVRFDEPISFKGLHVWTGLPNGEKQLESGILEVSTDGKSFEHCSDLKIVWPSRGKHAALSTWMTGAKLPAKVQAIRIRPGEQKHPLFILEIHIDSDPPVTKFRYPVEFTVDV